MFFKNVGLVVVCVYFTVCDANGMIYHDILRYLQVCRNFVQCQVINQLEYIVFNELLV